MSLENTETTELDTGWIAAGMLIMEIAKQVVGPMFEVTVVPDPDGRNPSKKPGIYVQLNSHKYEDIGGSMVVGFDAESFDGIRQAFCSLSTRILLAENQKELQEGGSLLVPEKKLLIPR